MPRKFVDKKQQRRDCGLWGVGGRSLLSQFLLLFGCPEMAAADDKRSDFYAVLGLKKECSAAELKNAYKKLALVSI